MAVPRPGPVWTPEEDAILRTGYANRYPLARLEARLPGRTLNAIILRAKRIGVVRRPVWTAEEDRILRTEWGVCFSRRTLREKLPGRSWCAIARHAQTLGLGSPARGLTSIRAAARATGYSVLGLLGVLHRQGVVIRRHCGNHENVRAYAWHLVDMLDIEEAIARDLRDAATTETIAEAARRHGCTRPTMRRRLRAAGVVGATTRGQPARIDPRIIDAAMRGEHVGAVVAPVPTVRAAAAVVCRARPAKHEERAA